MFDEGRVVPVGIVNAGVVMVAHRRGEEDLDAGLFGGHRETVDERVVGFLIRPHQELPLRTAAGDHVRATREDVTGR
jgi:hypothetical protein